MDNGQQGQQPQVQINIGVIEAIIGEPKICYRIGPLTLEMDIVAALGFIHSQTSAIQLAVSKMVRTKEIEKQVRLAK